MILGVTGGIATGKSTFARLLVLRIRAQIFDADRAAHELLAEDPATHAAILDAFGPDVFDAEGKPDRVRLRKIVFSDELQRLRLEAILHPVIRSRWVALAEQTVRTGGWLCVDIPLLFETGVEANFDRTIVVGCSPATQRRRLTDLRGLDDLTADRMIAAQFDLTTKIKKADHLIWNDATDVCLEGQVALLSDWLLQSYGRN